MFCLPSLKLESTQEKATDRDLLGALLAAASKLSFRAGASKSVILAPCASCARSEETATVFAEASSMLLEADVRLHVLQRDEMPFRRARKVAALTYAMRINLKKYIYACTWFQDI